MEYSNLLVSPTDFYFSVQLLMRHPVQYVRYSETASVCARGQPRSQASRITEAYFGYGCNITEAALIMPHPKFMRHALSHSLIYMRHMPHCLNGSYAADSTPKFSGQVWNLEGYALGELTVPVFIEIQPYLKQSSRGCISGRVLFFHFYRPEKAQNFFPAKTQRKCCKHRENAITIRCHKQSKMTSQFVLG